MRTRAILFAGVIVISLAADRQAAGQSGNSEIRGLINRMSLEEKISLLHGARDPESLGQAGYWPGLPRLGIPPLRLADGPAGINVNQDATAMPAPIGLAATFNPEATRLCGVVLGREARALSQNVLLVPYVNIVRDPLFRRNHTTLSEDPLLAARLGAELIRGIQSQGVMAQIKHLAGYSGLDNVIIDERSLHEIYLPAFEAGVKAGVASLMCAFNRINGLWACENSELQNGLLRQQWGFQGFVTSDWGATHSTGAITKGLDLEMPGRAIAGRQGGPYFREELQAAVESGAIPVAAIDQAVSRILVQMKRFNLLGRKSPAPPLGIDIEADAKIARIIAEQAAVLLTNAGDALPLAAADLVSLAVIGPTGGQLAAGFMGERAAGFESRLRSPLEALEKLAPQAKISYSVGVDLTGVPIPDYKGATVFEPGAEYSWAGTVSAQEEGDYTFMVQPVLGGGSEGGGTIAIDSVAVARTGGAGFGGSGVAAKKWSSLLPTADGRDNGRGTIHLTAGAHHIEITAHSTGERSTSIRFAWMTPELRRAGIEAAVAAARAVKTPLVFAWYGTGDSLSLPENQDELIEEIAAANPRTIVILNTGGPVAMPWKDKVRAILQMWFPGQEGGWATADILLGRANPAGRLPVTFPVKIEDTPAHAEGHPERWKTPPPPGGTGINPNAPAAVFSEGIAVGYRWYDQQKIEPLFPFGYGLSYTRFEYGNLSVKRNGNGADVTFTLRNRGSRRGVEVAQVYVGPPAGPPVPMVPQSLAGFQRIELEPGQTKSVTIHIDARGLSFWSIGKHDWVIAVGSRPVYVGSSSRDIQLQGTIP
jgi:beta-glucosidase